MKITINNYNKTYSAETDEDLDAESLADIFKGLMINMGYHPSNVDELFNTEYKWFTQEEIDNNRQGHLKVDNEVEEWQNDLYKQAEDNE
ncbi:MAG: hypothetical protein ACR2ON_00915 [Paracoccaceae bacterium]